MPATKISDLLPLADDAANPHPYQVFGLDDGEQDTATITAAVKGIVRQLKAAKSETDSQLWNQAAKLVQDARVALADPEKKAQLDARFGIIQIDDVPATHGDPLAGVLPSADPLAAVLPAADPLAAVLPAADPLASVLPSSDPLAPAQEPTGVSDIGVQAVVVPPGILGDSVSQPTDSESSLSDHFNPAAAASTASPVIANTGIANPVSADTDIANSLVVPADEDRRSGTSNKSRRRKRPVLGMLMFGTFALGMVSIIGALVYFLAFGSGRVEITSSDGQLSFTTDSTQTGQGESVVSQPRAVPDRPKPQPLDSVMGSLVGNGSPPSRPNEPSGLAASMQTPEPPTGSEPSAMPAPAMNPEPDSPAAPETMPAEVTPPVVTTPEDPGTEPAEPPMETEPAEPPLTDAMIAEAEKALQNVRQLIRSANWKEMKGAAEGATEIRMNESQQAEAEALYEVADLASYYRVGIERAVNELNVGNDFAVTENFRVIVVEKGDDLLVVRYNEKNRSFTFDEFPFSLAHKLASFSVSDSPTGEAAKAVYQAIAPKSTEDYRAESLQWLRGINGEVEEADPKRMADTIAALFAEDA